MARKKENKVSEEYFKEVLERLKVQTSKEKHKQAVQAGKEFALLIAWLDAVGAGAQGDKQTHIAGLLADYPEALKIVLEYYEELNKAPRIAKGLLEGFQPTIREGKLQIHFNWNVIDIDKLGKAVQVFLKEEKA